MNDLNRFIQAQKDGGIYNKAYSELSEGQRTSRWIWFIFPQIKGLGRSDKALKYGIKNLQEAYDYLHNDELFENYAKISYIVLQQLNAGSDLAHLMGGEIDALKLISSTTLFYETAALIAVKEKKEEKYSELAKLCALIINKAKEQGRFPCATTLNKIGIERKTWRPPTPKENATHSKSAFFTMLKTQQIELGSPSNKNKQELNQALTNYIATRKKEKEFHHNFLGLLSFIYKIQDSLMGTEHYNSKNRKTKIRAAEKIKEAINHPEKNNTLVLSSSEKKALAEGRLGKIIASHGGLDNILQAPSNKPSNDKSVK